MPNTTSAFAAFGRRFLSKIIFFSGILIMCVGSLTVLIINMGSKFALLVMIFGAMITFLGTRTSYIKRSIRKSN